MEYKGFTYTPTPKTAWDNLSMLEKSEMMKVAVKNGITDLKTIREKYNEFAEGGDTNPYTVGATVDALYASNPREEFLGEPSHHYDFTQSEEWANAHGYYPDARGHRDDRVKKVSHPSHPSRGTWDRDKFILSDFGMETPNYTLFGLNDGGQDPQATLIYNNGIVLPELTITPKENYIDNPYDNIRLHFANGGNKFAMGGDKRGRMPAHPRRGNEEKDPKAIATYQQYESDRAERGKVDATTGASQPINTETQKAYDFINTYLGSEGFKQRYENNYKYASVANPIPRFKVPNVIYQRENIRPHATPANRTIFVPINEEANKVNLRGQTPYEVYRKYGITDFPYQGTITHEMAHVLDRDMALGLSPKHWYTGLFMPATSEYSTAYEQLTPKTKSTELNEHDKMRSENYADLIEFRQLLYDNGIYDSTKKDNPFTKEHLKKAKDKFKNIFIRPFNTFSDEELINIMNTVASTRKVNWSNIAAEGGSIHIAPSKRGTFTAAAKKHGMGVQEFASKVLANKDDYSPAMVKKANFARNASKWHGDGGNLFSGEEEGSQQMQIGRPFWQSQTPQPLFFNLDFPVNGGSLQEVIVTGDKTKSRQRLQQVLDQRQSDYLTASNDNIWIDSNLTHRSKNLHLAERAEEGAKAHAAWEKEHPVLNTIGTALGAAPFAVAAAPVLASPYVDAVLTSGFGAHGLNHAINEGIDGWGDAAMTTLEVAPLGRVIKPAVREIATVVENYRYPFGRPQVPDGYLTIKPQIKSYNNSITEVPFFTWGNDNRFKVSPTKESYKEIYSQLSAAKKYKESPEYADLVRKAAQESEELGIGDFPEDLFIAPNGKSIKLIFENRPKGKLGEYVPEDNIMKLDMPQSKGMEVPYHEGIHWQRVGNPDNIGPNFSKWWKARKSGQSDDVQQKLFENFRDSEEYKRYIKRRNADRYLEYKVDNALYPFADNYLRARGELQAHGLEAGRAIGLKPFLPYPGMKSALNAIDKARSYNPYLNDVKSGGEENVKRFWDILTGQYAPSLIPLGLVGTGYGLTNK